jgi:hypothetical protein
VGRTHTSPEHIGRQGVHSKATGYPLKVLREAHLSVTFTCTWSTTLAINIEQKKHSKWDPSKLAEHHLKMSAIYANYPEKTFILYIFDLHLKKHYLQDVAFSILGS